MIPVVEVTPVKWNPLIKSLGCPNNGIHCQLPELGPRIFIFQSDCKFGKRKSNQITVYKLAIRTVLSMEHVFSLPQFLTAKC